MSKQPRKITHKLNKQFVRVARQKGIGVEEVANGYGLTYTPKCDECGLSITQHQFKYGRRCAKHPKKEAA